MAAGQGIVPKASPPSPWVKAPGGPRKVLPGGNVPKTLGGDSRVPRAGMLLPSLLGTGWTREMVSGKREERTLVPVHPAPPHLPVNSRVQFSSPKQNDP